MSSYKIGIICKNSPESKKYINNIIDYFRRKFERHPEYEYLDFRSNVDLNSIKKLIEVGICSHSIYHDNYSTIFDECDEVHLVDMRIPSHNHLNVITHNSQFK